MSIVLPCANSSLFLAEFSSVSTNTLLPIRSWSHRNIGYLKYIVRDSVEKNEENVVSGEPHATALNRSRAAPVGARGNTS